MKLLTYRIVKLSLLATILTAILEVAVSYSLSYLVADTMNSLIRHILVIVTIYIFYGSMMFLNGKIRALSIFVVSQDIKQKTDKWISHLDYTTFHKKDYGERLSVYVNDVNKVLDLTLNKYFSMVEKATTALFIFLSLWSIHYSMALIALVSFAIMTAIPNLFQSALAKHILSVQEAKENYLAKMRELLQGFDTFMENTAFTIFLKKSRKAAFSYAKTNLEADEFTSFMSATLTLANSLLTVLALGMLSYNVMKGHIQVGAFLSVTALLPSFGSSVMEFLSEKEFYHSGQALYLEKFSGINQEDFVEAMFTKTISKSPSLLAIKEEHCQSSQEEIEELELNNIRLSYDQTEIVFPDNITFKKGKKYAIIGESGCGKSSLLKIMTGQIHHQKGEYLVNQKQPSKDLFHSLSYINQTTFLFNDTIRHNIDLFNEHSDERLLHILKMLKLESFRLEDEIHDNGKNLSGGQRQRLAIARALLRKKSLLLLDEATASLDKETSQLIEHYVLGQARTVIMVTHHMTPQLKEQLDELIILE